MIETLFARRTMLRDYGWQCSWVFPQCLEGSSIPLELNEESAIDTSHLPCVLTASCKEIQGCWLALSSTHASLRSASAAAKPLSEDLQAASLSTLDYFSQMVLPLLLVHLSRLRVLECKKRHQTWRRRGGHAIQIEVVRGTAGSSSGDMGLTCCVSAIRLSESCTGVLALYPLYHVNHIPLGARICRSYGKGRTAIHPAGGPNSSACWTAARQVLSLMRIWFSGCHYS